MANNRDEVAVFIEALAAIVDLEELKEVLNDNFCQSLTFRKDVTFADTAAGTKTLDFTDIDYITVTQSANSTYTLSNIAQGEIKYLKLTKSAGHTVDFTGATDVSQRQDYIDNTVTDVIYRITNKDNSIYIESVNVDNNIELKQKVIQIGDWNMDTTISVSIAHGISDWTKIKVVDVQIYADDDAAIWPEAFSLNVVESSAVPGSALAMDGAWILKGANVFMSRVTGGQFDTTIFDKTSYNRGFITIWHEE